VSRLTFAQTKLFTLIVQQLFAGCAEMGFTNTAGLPIDFRGLSTRADISRIEIPQRSSVVLSFLSEARGVSGSETAQFHHAARRRGGGAARSAAAGTHAPLAIFINLASDDTEGQSGNAAFLQEGQDRLKRSLINSGSHPEAVLGPGAVARCSTTTRRSTSPFR
jgi:hypothetical protein